MHFLDSLHEVMPQNTIHVLHALHVNDEHRLVVFNVRSRVVLLRRRKVGKWYEMVETPIRFLRVESMLRD